jgi:hypothetical protein
MAAPIFIMSLGAGLLALGATLNRRAAYEAGRRDQDRSWRAAATGRSAV